MIAKQVRWWVTIYHLPDNPLEVDIDKRRLCTLSQYRNTPHDYAKKLRQPAV